MEIPRQDSTIPTPSIMVDEGVNSSVVPDGEVLALAMRARHITDETISDTTFYIDSADHFTVRGSMWPAALAHLRFGIFDPTFRNAPGPVIRLSSIMKGQQRTDDQIMQSAHHEIEHVAQLENEKWVLALGWLTMAGLSAAGAVVGSELTHNQNYKLRVAAAVGGLLAGYYTGYVAALHEHRARHAAANKD